MEFSERRMAADPFNLEITVPKMLHNRALIFCYVVRNGFLLDTLA
jgi:hypothetical protein